MTEPTAPVEDMGEFLHLQFENSRQRLARAVADNLTQPDWLSCASMEPDATAPTDDA